jgi:hypothetical protein
MALGGKDKKSEPDKLKPTVIKLFTAFLIN